MEGLCRSRTKGKIKWNWKVELLASNRGKSTNLPHIRERKGILGSWGGLQSEAAPRRHLVCPLCIIQMANTVIFPE